MNYNHLQIPMDSGDANWKQRCDERMEELRHTQFPSEDAAALQPGLLHKELVVQKVMISELYEAVENGNMTFRKYLARLVLIEVGVSGKANVMLRSQRQQQPKMKATKDKDKDEESNEHVVARHLFLQVWYPAILFILIALIDYDDKPENSSSQKVNKDKDD
ncbi:serine/threonine-protein phosphatase 6 regulatory ankyrin repeat subunit B [Spatholobus suberectus]|nr:serine/threonine-protein phosphatase 6 regulatory ankyrin repeat subunit B [Spatholobus suberectus]